MSNKPRSGDRGPGDAERPLDWRARLPDSPDAEVPGYEFDVPRGRPGTGEFAARRDTSEFRALRDTGGFDPVRDSGGWFHSWFHSAEPRPRAHSATLPRSVKYSRSVPSTISFLTY